MKHQLTTPNNAPHQWRAGIKDIDVPTIEEINWCKTAAVEDLIESWSGELKAHELYNVMRDEYDYIVPALSVKTRGREYRLRTPLQLSLELSIRQARYMKCAEFVVKHRAGQSAP